MSLQQIARWNHCTTGTVTFTTDIATTGGFGFSTYAGAMLLVDSGTATLTFYVRPTDGSSSYYAVQDSGAAVTVDVSPGNAVSLPESLFAASHVQAVSSSGNVVCRVLLKG